MCECLGDWQQQLKESLDQLTELLCGDELLSAYELQSSGLAPSLLQVLSPQPNGAFISFSFRGIFSFMSMILGIKTVKDVIQIM